MKFNGDIIITDPCYIVKRRDESTAPKWDDFFQYKTIYDYPDFNSKTRYSKMFFQEDDLYELAYKKWDNENPDDWDVCDCGEYMEDLGIYNYISRSTIYGDWSCHVFNTDTKEILGQFCADSGMVAVFLLDEVLKYNPNFNYHVTKPWTTTLIKDFDGDVSFIVKTVEEERQVEVVGRGINSVTGEFINFVGKQTGF